MNKYNIKFITSSGTPAVIATQVYCVCYRAPNGSTTYYYVSEENWRNFENKCPQSSSSINLETCLRSHRIPGQVELVNGPFLIELC